MDTRASSILTGCKAVVLDFIGTLVSTKPDVQKQVVLLHKSLQRSGYNIPYTQFAQAYDEASKKYRQIRLTKLVEVTNAVWVSEALNKLGFNSKQDEEGLVRAVEAYFKPYIGAMKVVPCARRVLKKLHRNFKLGLLSNFTYAPVVYQALKRFHLREYFDAVVISHTAGCRKPHPKIFKMMLKALDVSPSEAVAVGDDIYEDITGAKSSRLRTILVQQPGGSLRGYGSSVALRQPDLTVKNICVLEDVFEGTADAHVRGPSWKPTRRGCTASRNRSWRLNRDPGRLPRHPPTRTAST